MPTNEQTAPVPAPQTATAAPSQAAAPASAPAGVRPGAGFGPGAMSTGAMLAMQRTMGNRAVQRIILSKRETQSNNIVTITNHHRLPIRRLVHNIGNDTTSINVKNNLIKKSNSNPVNDQSILNNSNSNQQSSLFEGLGENEKLYIIGHGDGKGHIENLDAEGFVNYLINNGFTKGKHNGPIDLVSCFSADKTPEDEYLYKKIVSELRTRGFKNQITGFKGILKVDKDGNYLTVNTEFLEEFDRLTREANSTVAKLNEAASNMRKCLDLSKRAQLNEQEADDSLSNENISEDEKINQRTKKGNAIKNKKEARRLFEVNNKRHADLILYLDQLNSQVMKITHPSIEGTDIFSSPNQADKEFNSYYTQFMDFCRKSSIRYGSSEKQIHQNKTGNYSKALELLNIMKVIVDQTSFPEKSQNYLNICERSLKIANKTLNNYIPVETVQIM